jgi:hypothetical protein
MSNAIRSINSVQNTYEQFMQLRGPVEYWTQKSKSHRSRSKVYRDTLIKFAKIAGSGVVALLIGIAWVAFDHAKTARPDQPAALYLVLATIGVVVTTMAFWAARVLVVSA